MHRPPPPADGPSSGPIVVTGTRPRHFCSVPTETPRAAESPSERLPCTGCDFDIHQFGRMVRRKREAAGLSQEALSAAAGRHQTYVGLLERGLRMPSILVAKKVAEALGTTMGGLLDEVDREPAGRPGRGSESG